MKKILMLLILTGCCSGEVDKDTNVSNADYKACLIRVQENLVGNVQPTVNGLVDAAVKPADVSEEAFMAWKKSKRGLVSDTALLISTTLAGHPKK